MTNLKLTVIDKADFWEINEFAEFAKSKGYEVLLVDNGNIVFNREDK